MKRYGRSKIIKLDRCNDTNQKLRMGKTRKEGLSPKPKVQTREQEENTKELVYRMRTRNDEERRLKNMA